jgi:putative endonuclease
LNPCNGRHPGERRDPTWPIRELQAEAIQGWSDRSWFPAEGRTHHARGESPGRLYPGNKRYGTLYTGVTSDLRSRVQQQKHALIAGFTKAYGVKMLVWYEYQGSMEHAIRRERNIKEWKRAWKITLIEDTNPHCLDLSAQVCGRDIDMLSLESSH